VLCSSHKTIWHTKDSRSRKKWAVRCSIHIAANTLATDTIAHDPELSQAILSPNLLLLKGVLETVISRDPSFQNVHISTLADPNSDTAQLALALVRPQPEYSLPDQSHSSTASTPTVAPLAVWQTFIIDDPRDSDIMFYIIDRLGNSYAYHLTVVAHESSAETPMADGDVATLEKSLDSLIAIYCRCPIA
jgi:hypothetical protein